MTWLEKNMQSQEEAQVLGRWDTLRIHDGHGLPKTNGVSDMGCVCGVKYHGGGVKMKVSI